MSIYASIFDIGSEHKPTCKRIKRLRPKLYEQDDSKPCTCGAAPIKYQHSGVLPHESDVRDGIFYLAAIPSHIDRSPERKALGRDDTPWWPYLRVSLHVDGDDTVVLTHQQVTLLRDALTDWLSNAQKPKSRIRP